MEISQKALKSANERAILTASSIKARYFDKKVTTWKEIEDWFNLTIPPVFSDLPLNYANLESFLHYWKSTYSQRLQDEFTAASEKAKDTLLKVDKNVSTYHKVTLLPEQQPVVNRIEELFASGATALLQDGGTGSGKTYVAAAWIANAIARKAHITPTMPVEIPYRYMVVTKKTVVESYKRVLEDFGLGPHIGHLIFVTTYSALTSSVGEIFFREEYDPYKDTNILKVNPILCPIRIVWDEGHALNNPETKQTKLSLAVNELDTPPQQLFMTATPWACVNHSRTFVLACGKVKFGGQPVTKENFSAWAGTLGQNPHKPNIEAAKKLRVLLSESIVSFPKVRWPHKAINSVLIVDFEQPSHRKIYDQAFDIYQERKRKAGLNTNYGSFDAFVALGQFRKTVEPLRVPAMAEIGMSIRKKNKCVVIGCAFRETVAQMVYRLDKMGVPRSDISIIWGGRRKWKQDLLLNDDQLNELLAKGTKGLSLTSEEISSLQETILYRTERIMNNETAEEQKIRLSTMSSLGLMGDQSPLQRQREIDKFQSGESHWCIFTLAAGGVGLSLDQNSPDLLPREVLVTPSYSGAEFKQALGRCVRRTTLSDTYQYMCYMKDTVESDHVAPLIDKKMKFISAITQSNFNIIDLDTTTYRQYKFRTQEEILRDAEEESSQLTAEELSEDTTDEGDDE